MAPTEPIRTPSIPVAASNTTTATRATEAVWSRRASTAVAESRVADPPAGDVEPHLLRAIDAADERLGNTHEVCRISYLHPMISEAFRDGSLRDARTRSRRRPWLGRAESAVNRLMATRTNDDV